MAQFHERLVGMIIGLIIGALLHGPLYTLLAEFGYSELISTLSAFSAPPLLAFFGFFYEETGEILKNIK